MAQGAERIPLALAAVFGLAALASLVWSGLASRLRIGSIARIGLRGFELSLLIFWGLLRTFGRADKLALAFFIWGSIFSLMAPSLFWSRIVAVHGEAEARALFPLIAAGGTAGALVGPLLVKLLVERLGPLQLMLVSAIFIEMGAQMLRNVGGPSIAARNGGDAQASPRDADYLGGNWLTGARPALTSGRLRNLSIHIVGVSMLGSLLYVCQARIVSRGIPTLAGRTLVMATMDFWSNAGALFIQFLATGAAIRRLGPVSVLGIVPVLGAAAGAILAWRPSVDVLMGIQVTRRLFDYALTRPAREMLFTCVDAEQKYKTKSFVDVVAQRFGDALGAFAEPMSRGSPSMFVGFTWAFAAVALLAVRRLRTAEVRPLTDRPTPI